MFVLSRKKTKKQSIEEPALLAPPFVTRHGCIVNTKQRVF